MTDDENWNRRREAAEAAADLRDMMEEILGAPAYDEIEAKRYASAALDGIEDAEVAIRLWRDSDEEAVEILGEESRVEDGGDDAKHLDGGVVEIDGEKWRLGAALRALSDGELAVDDVLPVVDASECDGYTPTRREALMEDDLYRSTPHNR